MINVSFDHVLVFEEGATVDADLLSNIDSLITGVRPGWHVLALDCPAHCRAKDVGGLHFVADTGVSELRYVYSHRFGPSCDIQFEHAL